MTLSQATIDKLIEAAQRETWDEGDDDSVIDDFAGGNVDDAYQGGERAGETNLAREILTELGIAY